MVNEYEYDEEGQRMRMNCLGSVYGSSIEDYPVVMAKTIDNLMELKKVARIVLADVREYEYDFDEARMLIEIANVIERIIKEHVISIVNIVVRGHEEDSAQRYNFLQKLLNDLRYDPIDAYKRLLRETRHVKVKAERADWIERKCAQHYIDSALIPIKQMLESCKMIQIAMPQLSEHRDRALYRKIFHPTVRPNFIYTKYISLPPAGAELVERYQIEDTYIEIYQLPGKVRRLYQIVPPEFRLSEAEYTLLDTARRYLGRHEPRETELEEPERIRENLFTDKGKTDFGTVINHSINQTLGRSINTSFTLILVLIALYFTGPINLKYFILTLLVGVTTGIYSSIFIASPVLLLTSQKRRG